jgi:hypothetical protein
MTAFDQMPPDAKVWIYAANRKLTLAEQVEITGKADSFVTGWTAHQNQLKASFAVVHDVFFVLMVDPNYNEVSGCGIDKSVHFMQDLDKTYNLNLFNRLQIELFVDGEVILTGKQKLSVMMQEGTVNEHTMMFNKNITDKHVFDSQFQIPLSKSWVFPSLQATQTT